MSQSDRPGDRMRWAIGQEHLTHRQRVVLAAIAFYGLSSWPAIDTIAADTGIHPRNVRRVVTDLEDAGVLSVEHRDGTTNLYTLAMELPEAVNGFERAPDVPDDGDDEPLDSGWWLHPDGKYRPEPPAAVLH